MFKAGRKYVDYNIKCPICESHMIKKRGILSGVEFLGCEMWDENKCRGTRKIDYIPSNNIIVGRNCEIVPNDDDVEMHELMKDCPTKTWINFPELYESPSTVVVDKLEKQYASFLGFNIKCRICSNYMVEKSGGDGSFTICEHCDSDNIFVDKLDRLFKKKYVPTSDELSSMAIVRASQMQDHNVTLMGIPPELLFDGEIFNNNGVTIMNEVEYKAQILNDNYKIAVVIFKDDGEPFADYIEGDYTCKYKIPPELKVKKLDVLLVNTSNKPIPNYKQVKCIKILPNEDRVYEDQKMLKWIVCKFDDSAHLDSIQNENEIIEMILEEDTHNAIKERQKNICEQYSSKFIKKINNRECDS